MATVGVCRDCLVPAEFDGHVYTCPECSAHTRYDNKTGEVDGVTLLTVEITPGLARKFGLTYVGSPGERVELVPEHDLSRVREALDAFDEGRAGTYGPYQVTVSAGLTQLRRGVMIEKQRPDGLRVKITGPTVDGSGSYVGRMGWARPNWPHCDQSVVRVIPDGQGWGVRGTAFPKTSVEEVA